LFTVVFPLGCGTCAVEDPVEWLWSLKFLADSEGEGKETDLVDVIPRDLSDTRR
jgi:hypothetical protein